MKIMKILEDVWNLIGYFHGEELSFILDLTLAIFIFNCGLSIIGQYLENIFRMEGLWYAFDNIGFWNYFVLCIYTIYLGWRSKRDD